MMGLRGAAAAAAGQCRWQWREARLTGRIKCSRQSADARQLFAGEHVDDAAPAYARAHDDAAGMVPPDATYDSRIAPERV
jgi:hypothetical protein